MPFTNPPGEPQRPHPTSLETRTVEWLQAELHRSEQRLHEALADVLATNAELGASNLEQQLLNEELRAANEELAASEGELQTANGELERRVGQLAQANSDMRSVVESSRIAIVFLDEELRIRSFTPAMRDVLHLVEADHGRPVTDLALQIGYPGLAADLQSVLDTHGTVERHAGHKRTGAQYLVRLLPHRRADERVAGVVATFLDITAAVTAERALWASDERFRRMAAAVPALLFIADAETHWDYVNPPFYALTGRGDGDALRLGWAASLHPDDLSPTRDAWRDATRAAATLEHEARLRRADGSWCWHLVRAVPQLDEAGRAVRWYGSCTDIDHRRRAEQRQSLLLAEAQQRTKRILAVMRFVLTRTLESNTDPDYVSAHLDGRIGALSRIQSIAARTVEGLVALEDIIHEELAAHGGLDDGRYEVSGPPVRLPGRTADVIGMAIHELATNSHKYGALAAANGRVAARWRWTPASAPGCYRLTLEWKESGVPVTDLRPRRSGFGRELIEHGLPQEIGAVTAMEFRPGGLCCSIAFNLDGPAASQAGTAA